MDVDIDNDDSKWKMDNIKSENISTDDPDSETADFTHTIALSPDLLNGTSECHLEGEENANLQQVYQEQQEEQFPCHICGKCFRLKKYLSSHIRIHTSPKKHECNICAKQFLTSKELRLHLRTHTGERPHQCPECEKCFSQFGHLQDHIRRVHREERNFQCMLCDKRYLTLKELNGHIRTHSGVKPYPCLECHKAFGRATHLNVHVQRVHRNDRKFECEVCFKKCFSTSELKGHLRTHTGEKPYQCSECQKEFTNASHLKRHVVQTHVIKEKPFSNCEICGRTFTHLANCVRHAKTCKKVQSSCISYQCSQCMQCYEHVYDLKSHILEDHQRTLQEPFTCSECERVLSNLWSLDRHFRNIHAGKILVL